MEHGKLYYLFRSRKFWASFIALLSSVGLFAYSDAQQSELVDAIMVIIPAIVGGCYVIGTAIEDATR